MQSAVYLCTLSFAEGLSSLLRENSFRVEPIRGSQENTSDAIAVAGGQWLKLSDGSRTLILTVGQRPEWERRAFDYVFECRIVLAVASRWTDRLLRRENLALAQRAETVFFASGGDEIISVGRRIRDW